MSEKDENVEQSFNDAELQDIMNEIESLEKEFVEEEGAAVVAEESSAPEEVAAEADEVVAEDDDDLVQEAETFETESSTIEEEVDEPASIVEEIAAEVEEELAAEASTEDHHTDNVVAMPTAKATQHKSGEGYMQFSGQGEMDMQLNFQLGSETATVSIKDGGLTVTLSGVELNLSENGCEVNMEGGVKFSVPLTGSQSQGKKAA